jgi:RsiW-degrading membrane proteinase PrsW (M82 family)
MNLHIQSLVALIITAVCGYTASIVKGAYSSIYRGQPLPPLTEVTLQNGTTIYWLALPIAILALWGMAAASKSQQKKSMIMISISILSAISVIVLLVAWSRPLVRTTFALS